MRRAAVAKRGPTYSQFFSISARMRCSVARTWSGMTGRLSFDGRAMALVGAALVDAASAWPICEALGVAGGGGAAGAQAGCHHGAPHGGIGADRAIEQAALRLGVETGAVLEPAVELVAA